VPFRAEDVLFTITLLQDDAFPGPPDLRQFWRTVEVDLIDAQTVRFTLAQPLATFTDYLRIGIVPEHVLRGATGATLRAHPFNLSPVGTGPYQFAGLIGDGSRATGVRLRFAPTYSERPEGQAGFAIRQLVFHCVPTFADAVAAFQRGEVNTINPVMPDALGQVSALPLNPLPAYRPSLGAVIYNWRGESAVFLRDLRFRQALAYSLNRPALVQKHLANRAIVADGPVLPSSWAYAPGVRCPTFDLDRAQRDLGLVQLVPTALPPDVTPEASAMIAPADGKFRFQLLVSDDPALAAMAEDIVNSWRALGLLPTLVVVDRITFRERLTSGNFESALVELNLEPLADPDPYSLWRQLPAEGGLNFGGFNDRRLSEIMESARREPNGITRAALYRDFQQLFCDRAAAIPLFYPAYFYGVDQRLQGVQIGFMSNPSDRFRTIHDWRLVP
jgi:peptide/nickel transport system substrate-binding protein